MEGVFAILDSERIVVEPAAGRMLAAAERHAAVRPEGTRACLVLCGSNADFEDLVQIRANLAKQ